MIPRCLPVALFAIISAPSLLRAQQQPTRILADPDQLEARIRVELVNDRDKMYEDIEILRRILDRKLESRYPAHTYQAFGIAGVGGMGGMQPGMPGAGMRGMQGGMGIAGGMMPVTVPMRSLEGAYLKGQGVVYTATLKSLQPSAKMEADHLVTEGRVEITLRESDWEKTRRQVRNEKEKPKKPEASKPPSLSDVLLKVLAENGHNFSQLGENESVTIILTVHESNPPAPARKSGGSGKGGSAKPGTQIRKTTGVALHRDDASDQELLGDLHQKQGHYEEALRAFMEAATREPGPSSKEAQRLYRKIAQCYLALGQDDKARKALDQILSFEKESAEAKDKPVPDVKPAAALPVKLIISAPKKLLDYAKAGKITFEEFRRQAHVETLRFDRRRGRE